MKRVLFLIIIAFLFSSCSILRNIERLDDLGDPTWESNFMDYKALNGNIYQNNSYCDPEMVVLEPDGLHLKAELLDTPIVRSKWTQKDVLCYYRIGWIDYSKVFKDVIYGTFEFEFIPPTTEGNFSALWFLRHPHAPNEAQFKAKIDSTNGNVLYLSENPPYPLKINYWLLRMDGSPIGRYIESCEGRKVTLKQTLAYSGDSIIISSDHIIPEFDLMENEPDGYMRSNVHYGYNPLKYRDTHFKIGTLSKTKRKVYKLTVKISAECYKIYLNGRFMFETDKGTSNEPLYPVLNNGVHPFLFGKPQDDFIIKSIKYFE